MASAGGPPFEVLTTKDLDRELTELKRRDLPKFKKIAKLRKHLGDPGPSHTALATHRWDGVVAGAEGRDVWYSHVENHTPAAWRAWWVYGPDRGQITLLQVGKHPRER